MIDFSIRKTWPRVLALAAISLAAIAQGPGGPPPGGPHGGPGGPRGGGLARGLAGFLGDAIDLTDSQRTQVRAILDQTRAVIDPLHEQLERIHEQERAAVTTGKSEQELRAIAQSAAPLLEQIHAAQLIAESKAFALLTAAQKAKLEKMRPEGPRRN